jgi:hypothetical protein
VAGLISSPKRTSAHLRQSINIPFLWVILLIVI